MNILANDGLGSAGVEMLEKAGFNVITQRVEQEDLIHYINENQVSALLVRSATVVRKDLIDACADLKFIGRGGVGMDNIDVDYARGKGLIVANTPAASSQSVAELVFAHLFGMCRSLHLSNREMPENGHTEFKSLKKQYSKGMELRGKTLGIVGMGRIGRSVASYALGIGMKVVAHDAMIDSASVDLMVNGENLKIKLNSSTLEEVIHQSDILTLHVPAQSDGKALIGKDEIDQMKDGIVLVNVSRGGIIDESELLQALDSGKVAMAALDVFNNEPTPDKSVLAHPNVSLTPHIGAGTAEAQTRISTELAETIIRELS